MSVQDEVNPRFKVLTPHQLWLLDHQITAFWHGFGISNGLDITRDKLVERHFKNGDVVLVVKASYMRERLEDYLRWLRRYREKWNEKQDCDVYPRDFDDFLKSEQVHRLTRKPIFEMINLLQA